MKLNCLELFLNTLNGMNVNAFVLKKDNSNLELIDNRFRALLYEDFTYTDAFELWEHKIKKNSLMRKTDEFLFSYMFLRVPEEYLSAGDSSCLSIGPFSERRRNREEIYHIMQKK